MLAIIHLQDQRYWYPYSINIHAETKHYTHVVGLKPVKSISVGNCNEDMSLAVSAFTQHRHQLIKRTQTETNVLWTPFCFVCKCVSWVYTWAWAYSWAWVFFRAESSDLSHVGIYTGMGVISIWALFRYGRCYGQIWYVQLWSSNIFTVHIFMTVPTNYWAIARSSSCHATPLLAAL